MTPKPCFETSRILVPTTSQVCSRVKTEQSGCTVFRPLITLTPGTALEGKRKKDRLIDSLVCFNGSDIWCYHLACLLILPDFVFGRLDAARNDVRGCAATKWVSRAMGEDA